jgi:hypothetical protein
MLFSITEGEVLWAQMIPQNTAHALVVSHSVSVEVEVEVLVALLKAKHSCGTVIFNLITSQSVQRQNRQTYTWQPIYHVNYPIFFFQNTNTPICLWTHLATCLCMYLKCSFNCGHLSRQKRKQWETSITMTSNPNKIWNLYLWNMGQQCQINILKGWV